MIQSAHQTNSPTARGVIFDLDGTLADTLRDIANALNHALRAAHRPDAPIDAIRSWVGEGLPTLCRRAWPEADGNQIQELIRNAKSQYAAHPMDHTVLYPGVRELLTALAARSVPLAVFSNKPHDLTVTTVSGLGIESFFSEVRGYLSEDEKKPSPVAAIRMADGWRIPADRIVFVGDSATDLATALAGGMISVSVTWGFRSRAELEAAGAKCFVDHPAEILRMFDGPN